MASSPVRRSLALILALLAAAVAGCGFTADQRAAAVRFGEATREMADLAAEALVRTRQDVVHLRTRMVELGSQSVDLTKPASDLDADLDVDKLELRLRAAARLKAYGQLVRALAEEDSTARLKGAADSFIGGLSEVPGVNLPKEKADAIGALVSAVGGWFIDGQKKSALREVVPAARPAVDALIVLWKKEFDPKAPYWANALATTEERITGSLQNQINLLRPTPAGGAVVDGEVPLGEAEIALRRVRFHELRADAARRKVGLNELCERIQKALDLLKQANQDLENKMKYSDFSVESIQEYVGKVEECVRLYRVLRPQ